MQMTWGEVQLTAIQKMFLNTTAITVSGLSALKSSSNYATYFNAMPQAANEGIYMGLQRGIPLIKTHVITVADVPVSTSDTTATYDLQAILSDYKQLKYLMVDGFTYSSYRLAFNKLLTVLSDITVTLVYEAYPTRLDTDTLSSVVMDIPYGLAVALPFYIASELYKDDDIGLATSYRNQFEAELDAMRPEPEDIDFTDVYGLY